LPNNNKNSNKDQIKKKKWLKRQYTVTISFLRVLSFVPKANSKQRLGAGSLKED